MKKSYTEEDCRKETVEHINEVRKLLSKVIIEIEERGRVHDLSKLSSPELEIFTEYTPKLKSSTYGSEEYKENLKKMREALNHHYESNRHHPEHFKKYVCNTCFKEYKEKIVMCSDCFNCSFTEESDVSQMNLIDIIEMLCDWKAASMRHDDGDIQESLEINKERFQIDDQLYQILVNTVKEL